MAHRGNYNNRGNNLSGWSYIHSTNTPTNSYQNAPQPNSYQQISNPNAPVRSTPQPLSDSQLTRPTPTLPTDEQIQQIQQIRQQKYDMAWHIVDEYAIALQRSIQAGSVRPPFNAAQHRLVRLFEDTYEEFCKLQEQYDQLEEEQLELDSYDLARANVDDYALALSRSIRLGYTRPSINNAQHRIMSMFEDTHEEYRAIEERYDQLEAEHAQPITRRVNSVQVSLSHNGAHCSTCTCDTVSEPQPESAPSPSPINQLQEGEE
ncbi:hypothetical protein HBI56_038410 [Parastagonospora nodorum]|uniref:Uncharacterized protein n=1 Tax=Phaeosphaeria nodorum (strain SN15 / ATCC MYA-4574 / FGSC 10173) TaxID=321614 RepID=A0A7U2EUT6_PHANO|nr:hypothetical protein HBH56_068380 [Parastagonospora nodorum]QRC93503.1 hypothetical protein JI435_037190 [Parastagonospora nodorum SN15]KAH3932631.1 hypothetical protein HBH54_079730 [Parastagonospora nodorum]KAH4143864.1 hypothetical protein HBH45_034760 [Parastagonospora nodorum]KAH4165692.1 hypothetical protein HBH44_068610 [Parastagonospora nodorum]